MFQTIYLIYLNYCKDNKRSYLDSCLTAQGIFDNSSCLTTRKLYCAKSGSQAGYCTCENLHYFDSALLLCKQQKLNGQSCLSTSQCRTDLGLRCTNGVCRCLSNMYWSSSSVCSNISFFIIILIRTINYSEQ